MASPANALIEFVPGGTMVGAIREIDNESEQRKLQKTAA
jgi:hypothetical protein